MRIKKHGSCFALSLLAMAVNQAAYAAEEPQMMGEISVYGERPAAFRNITTSTEAADKALIESTNVINTEDTVKYLPSIQVRKRYIGDRNAILSSRNAGTIDSARSLVYADNVLVSMLLGNSWSYAPRWWFVAPQEIDRVDVSYGAHSAAYAGNAAGVVMVMKSKMPEKFEAHAEAQTFSQSFSLYGTDETYQGSRVGAFLGNKHDNFYWSLSAGHLDNEGHPMSFAYRARSTTAATTETVVTGAHHDKDAQNNDRVIFGATSIDHSIQDNAKVKLAYDFSPGSRLTYTLGFWRNDSDVNVESYLRNTAGNIVYSGNVNIDGFRYSVPTMRPSKRLEEHWMNSLTWRHDPKSGSDWAFEAALTNYRFGEDKTRSATTNLPGAASGGAGNVQLQDGTGWHTADLRADWRPERGKLGHDVAFGYHYDQHKLNDRTYNSTDWLAGNTTTISAGNTGKTETQALYVQDAINIGNGMTMTLGLRQERWRAFSGTTTSGATTLAYTDRNENFTSPKFSLSWAATDEWLLRGSLSRATRFPTVTELFQGSVSATTGTITNNDPNLKPEKIVAGELAAERGMDTGTMRISYFQDEVTDYLTRQTNTTVTPNVTNIQNVGKVRIRGVEASTQQRNIFVKGLDLTGSVTYANAKIRKNTNNPASVGKRMIRIPDWRATLAATWHQNDKLDFTLAGRYSGMQYNQVDNSDTNEGVYGSVSKFLVMDAKVNYRFDKHISVSVGVDNLNNDKHYAAHPYPQRTWIAQIKGSL